VHFVGSCYKGSNIFTMHSSSKQTNKQQIEKKRSPNRIEQRNQIKSPYSVT